MDGKERASWTDADLASLLAGYFGEKLSPAQLRRLVADVAADQAEQPEPGHGEGEAETWSDTERHPGTATPGQAQGQAQGPAPTEQDESAC